MSTAIDIYIPAPWDTSVPKVLKAAGFAVTARERKLARGKRGRKYACTRDGKAITLNELPLREDSSYHYVVGISEAKDAAALRVARAALIKHGALDTRAYQQQSRGA